MLDSIAGSLSQTSANDVDRTNKYSEFLGSQYWAVVSNAKNAQNDFVSACFHSTHNRFLTFD